MVWVVLMCLLFFSSIAWTSQDKDLGVVNEAVGDRRGHGGGIEHISPFSEREISRQKSGLDLMPCADHLEKEV